MVAVETAFKSSLKRADIHVFVGDMEQHTNEIAYCISQSPFNSDPISNYLNAKWYLNMQAKLDAPHSDDEYLQQLEAEVATQKIATPKLNEVFHFLAARILIDYRESQQGFTPKPVAKITVLPK